MDQVNVPLRSGNVAAFNAAFAAAIADLNGATVYIPPGIYLTNDWVGFDLAEDKNVNLIVRGLSGFTFIRSNNQNEATLRMHTSSGNARGILVEDLVLEGGREGLSLRQVAYSRFNRIWFWGAKNDSLHVELGIRNVYHECRFDESAQGIRTGVEADAAVFISSEDTVSHCNFGEYSGGIIINGGNMLFDNNVGADCFTRRAIWYDYINDVLVDQAANLLPIKAAIILWQGSANINGFTGKATIRFVSAFRAYELLINGCRVQTDQDISGFIGFVNIVAGGATQCALHISASDFVWLGGRSGYFVADDSAAINHAMISAQLTVYSGSTVTALSSSAPALLNPGGQDNLVVTRTFAR
jgi:hypothetical protein